MQTMPIVKVRDLITALEAYIAQKRRTECKLPKRLKRNDLTES